MAKVKVHRMSRASSSINNGEGNVPKRTKDGQLYGSSQSTKRQIMEASGVYKGTDSLYRIAERHGINTPREVKEVQKAEGEGDGGRSQSEGKHIVPWDDNLEQKLVKAVEEGSVRTFEDLQNFVSSEESSGGKIYGHFYAYKKEKKNGGNENEENNEESGEEKQKKVKKEDRVYRIDGAYGTTGHQGLRRGRIAKDFWTVQGTHKRDPAEAAADNFGDKEIALEEYYWSQHNFDLRDEGIQDDLKKMILAAAGKVLYPRANRNNGNELSVEYSVIIVGDHTGINMPPERLYDGETGPQQFLQELIRRNQGRGFRYIAYLIPKFPTDEQVTFVENESLQKAIGEI